MKIDMTPSVVDRSILKNIIEVKETVATLATGKQRRAFTVADLWRIQKNATFATGKSRR